MPLSLSEMLHEYPPEKEKSAFRNSGKRASQEVKNNEL
jgi:hypothetical protein